MSSDHMPACGLSSHTFNVTARSGEGHDSLDGTEELSKEPKAQCFLDDSVSIVRARRGQRLKLENVPGPRENTALEHAMVVFTLSSSFWLLYLVPLATLACIYLAIWRFNMVAMALPALYFADILLPAGQYWPAFRYGSVWNAWRRYFRHRGVGRPLPFLAGDPSKRYIFAHFPHAVFPMGPLLTFPLPGLPSIGIPGPMVGAVASVLLQLPITKHIFAWLGCCSASRPELLRQLAQGNNIGLLPEGVAGIFQGANPSRERLFLRQHRGFVRLAIQAGADLVPIYHLGSSQLLSCYGLPWLSRRLRISLGLIMGVGLSPVPRRHDIITLCGDAVQVEQSDNPSEEQVQETHERFIAAIAELFDQHKHLLPGWEHKQLEII